MVPSLFGRFPTRLESTRSVFREKTRTPEAPSEFRCGILKNSHLGLRSDHGAPIPRHLQLNGSDRVAMEGMCKNSDRHRYKSSSRTMRFWRSAMQQGHAGGLDQEKWLESAAEGSPRRASKEASLLRDASLSAASHVIFFFRDWAVKAQRGRRRCWSGVLQRTARSGVGIVRPSRRRRLGCMRQCGFWGSQWIDPPEQTRSSEATARLRRPSRRALARQRHRAGGRSPPLPLPALVRPLHGAPRRCERRKANHTDHDDQKNNGHTATKH